MIKGINKYLVSFNEGKSFPLLIGVPYLILLIKLLEEANERYSPEEFMEYVIFHISNKNSWY